MESNYSGYADKVTNNTRKAYTKHNRKFARAARSIRKEVHCILMIGEWLKFFRDHHLAMYFDSDATLPKTEVSATQTEKIKVNAAKVKQAKLNIQPLQLEGIYQTRDSSYRIAIIKDKQVYRDYIGVILSSNGPEWKAGDVKLEMKDEGNKIFKVVFYNRQHVPLFDRLSFSVENGLKHYGWFKENVALQSQPSTFRNTDLTADHQSQVSFKQIDSNTAYMRIKSFSVSKYRLIDSIVKANEFVIRTLPYLIIDIRDNGGGGDISYKTLRPLLYTGPIHTIGSDFLVTETNLENFEREIKMANLPHAEEEMYIDKLQLARVSRQRYYPFVNDTTETLDTQWSFPKKVGIIINEWVASAAEQFLLEAKQSTKVSIYGTNTRGVLDYSNMVSKPFPCLSGVLGYPTTRSRRIEIGQGIDRSGIKPDIEIDLNAKGWLQKVLLELSKS